MREVRAAIEELESASLPVTNAKIAELLGRTEQYVSEVRAEIASYNFASIEEEEASVGQMVANQYRINESQDEVIEKLNEVLQLLSERERKLIEGYYYKGWTFRKIGEELGITESRVSQLHKEIIGKMRKIVG